MERIYQLMKSLLRSVISEDKYSKVKKIYKKNVSKFFYNLPDFIIVGAQKSGTSSLYSYLLKHPKILPARRKELHFFDNNFEEGVRWYRNHFPSKIKTFGNRITGEASPYYLYHPLAAKRIRKVVPDVKIIILLRDPVERAISHYWHEVNYTEAEKLPMDKAFEKEDERLKGEVEKIVSNREYSFKHQHFSYLERGEYLHQIRRYKRNFDSEQIKVINSERMFDNSKEVLEEVEIFLGVEPESLEVEEAKNKGDYEKETSDSLRKRLEEYYSEEKEKIESELKLSFH